MLAQILIDRSSNLLQRLQGWICKIWTYVALPKSICGQYSNVLFSDFRKTIYWLSVIWFLTYRQNWSRPILLSMYLMWQWNISPAKSWATSIWVSTSRKDQHLEVQMNPRIRWECWRGTGPQWEEMFTEMATDPSIQNIIQYHSCWQQ